MRLLHIFFLLVILNSCNSQQTSSELQTMIITEQALQQSNIVQLDRGDSFYADVKSELASARLPDQRAKFNKLSYVLSRMDSINLSTSKLILLIDSLKLQLLSSAGENTKSTEIIDRRDDNLTPLKINLHKLKYGNDVAASTDLFFSSNKSLNKAGKKLWKGFINYRKEIIRFTGTYSWSNGYAFNIDPISINHFTDQKSLIKEFTSILDSSNANLKEDRQVLIDLYIKLSKPELVTTLSGEKNHWINHHFKGIKLVEAISMLTVLQNDVLSARALALAHWKSKVGGCGYAFEKIIPMVDCPSAVVPGDTISFTALMAAFSENNQPKINLDNYPHEIRNNDDGTVTVKLVTPTKGSSFTIQGTLSIKNLSGVEKREEWRRDIKIIHQKN